MSGEVPDWASDARMFAKHVAQAPEDTERNELLAKRVMELAYERGRKEGIEEAAKYVTNLARLGARDSSKIRDTRMLLLFTDMEHTVVPAIRQLLEVKG